jgi:pimeloyl-ACP methyl ester carboxylesterase
LLAVTRFGVNLWGQRDHIILLKWLPSLRVPTLIVWGAQDKTIPVSHAYAAHRAIPGSQLHIFDRCGHCPQVERAFEFNQLVVRFFGGEVLEQQE